jgi:short-subunit dehydrogenase
MPNHGPLAVVTGASSGIGLELAKLAAQDGYDIIAAADRPLADAEQSLRALGSNVVAVEADLATPEGVRRLLAAVGDRPVDALFANAGHGLGDAFLNQDPVAIQHVIDTNISGTVALLHAIGNGMRRAGNGRILITGSIAGFEPGSYQAVYNGTKAFIDSFALALRDELKDTGVTVSCLMPGVTDTEFFERAGMLDTKLNTGKKMDPAEVAKIGYDAMKAGEADVVAGWKNKLAVALANVTPGERLAAQHAKTAKPGSAHN